MRHSFSSLFTQGLPLATLLLLVVSSSAHADLDGDTLDDPVLASYLVTVNDKACVSDGVGGFSASSDVDPTPGLSTAVALGDLDGDGAVDAVFAREGLNRACLGDGLGGFVLCSDVESVAASSQGVALGDVNNDGNLDAVFARLGPDRVCLGDGAGGFSSCADVDTTGNSYGVALGDLNGDGNLDVVFARIGTDRVCLGDGAGGFVCSDIETLTRTSLGVALGDVDGDGNLDAVMADNAGRDRVCLGDGAGGFSCSDVTATPTSHYGVALGDVDGDGALDAVFASAVGVDHVCLGDGAGGFGLAAIDTVAASTFGVALGDVNADGALDAVYVGLRSGAVNANRVCLGDGSGGFSPVAINVAGGAAAWYRGVDLRAAVVAEAAPDELSPAELIEALIEQVRASDLPRRVERGLVARLQRAHKHLDSWVGVLWMYSFKRLVKAWSCRRVDEDDAKSFVASADEIIELLADSCDDWPCWGWRRWVDSRCSSRKKSPWKFVWRWLR